MREGRDFLFVVEGVLIYRLGIVIAESFQRLRQLSDLPLSKPVRENLEAYGVEKVSSLFGNSASGDSSS